MKLRIIIVDDESLARDRLRQLLGREDDVEIVAECEDGAAAVQAVQELKPDVLLLDIQMPGMDGFDVLRKLDPQSIPSVIFVTAFDLHAVRAFDARALDYLLKPTSRARLAEALNRARERLASQSGHGMPKALMELLAERESGKGRLRRLPVRNGERTIFVPVEEVDWVEAAGNYVVLHAGPDNHILRETMSSLEEQLPADYFFRVSRSAILNLRRVKELQSVSSGEHVALLAGGKKVGITRSLREVEERLRLV